MMKSLLLPVLGCAQTLFGCTDFLIQATDKTSVVGRSMEFAVPLESQIALFPADLQMRSQAPEGMLPMRWTTKYAFIGLTALDINGVCDGINEQGLSLGVLWMPGSEYPPLSKDNGFPVVALEDLGNWILSSFSTLNEVKEGLQKIQFWAHEVPKVGIPPIHFALHEANGKSAVIEFQEGKIKWYDNPLGVLTNAPWFEWQVNNLRNYSHLTAVNAAPMEYAGTALAPLGQGTGLIGIPGDWTPPSRFVRIAILKNLAVPAKNSEENAILAMHLLNTVDIPYGTVRATKNSGFEYTQWIVVKDLNNLVLFCRPYETAQIFKISLKEELAKQPKGILKKPLIGTNPPVQ